MGSEVVVRKLYRCPLCHAKLKVISGNGMDWLTYECLECKTRFCSRPNRILVLKYPYESTFWEEFKNEPFIFR